ncbi:hypothetical protein QJS10_CPA10g01800 [Acorus calamus]|uniref:DEK-C domain-containing protein n=1 Tax=Acorus calamus TaxID=4465 RepID=A0AAV9DYB7_ACOCL|nr:hypothetical protein QJS10_CPA10g01800 [Acorus calamus]
MSTPLPLDRPVRERKSVQRLVASVEVTPVKEFLIEKGHGTPLKDIPNVAYKLSKRKSDDIAEMLHMILFGRKGKALHRKQNISQFSGFVWHENEEKQRSKVKEKLDKLFKDKLLEFCDVLDIPVSKTNARKEDLVVKLLDFLDAPHATTDVVIAEKEQSMKSRKRKSVSGGSASRSSGSPAKRSRKTLTKVEDTPKSKGKPSDSESESEDDDDEEVSEKENGVPNKDDDEDSEHSAGEKEDESEEDEEYSLKKKRGMKKSSPSSKRGDVAKKDTKKERAPKRSSATTSKSPKKRATITPSRSSKVEKSNDATKKKKTDDSPSNKSSSSKPAAKGRSGRKTKEAGPSEKELRSAICDILKKVDFNTATFTDILKKLAAEFKKDLTSRKGAIKLMIQDELTKLADEAEENDEDEEDGDAEDEKLEPAKEKVETKIR